MKSPVKPPTVDFAQLERSRLTTSFTLFPQQISENRSQMSVEKQKSLIYFETGRYKNSFDEISFLGKGGFGICHKV